MMCVTPNVVSKYEAVAMRKWDKTTEATFDDGKLIVTEN